MQKTFLSFSIALVAVITLLSVRIQFSQVSADSIPDTGTQVASTTTQLEQGPTLSDLPEADQTPTGAARPPAAVPRSASVEAPTPAAKPVTSKPEAKPIKKTLGTSEQYPERLIIPSLGINVPIVPVGVNSKGEMAVPPGNTNEVGWFKQGPMPGSVGSAVLDAHVFAAFKSLRYLKVGEDFFIQTSGGTKLRFRVEDSRVYALSELTSDMLFGNTGKRRVNLITCAGTFIKSMGTYDHRLVDYAVFVDEE